ncbi:hypothetical protein [Inquilinus sp.]|uniref:hypothetical protein n=1 Tax=Inquilinus sp. TaxID=1932117 RepID=UPI0031E12E59
MADGDTVVTNLFSVFATDISYRLAAAFGVGAMELGKHEFTSRNVDLGLLTEIVGADGVESFLLLASHGFRFFYLPNA